MLLDEHAAFRDLSSNRSTSRMAYDCHESLNGLTEWSYNEQCLRGTSAKDLHNSVFDFFLLLLPYHIVITILNLFSYNAKR